MTSRRTTGRNQRSRTEVVTILWRDIPAQVTARSGRKKKAIELPGRFQTAIDRAAMVAGKQTYDEYIDEWRRTTAPCGDDIDVEAETAAARLDREYPLDRLAQLAANGGHENPESNPFAAEDGPGGVGT